MKNNIDNVEPKSVHVEQEPVKSMVKKKTTNKKGRNVIDRKGN